jgi:hypothetical protein
MKAGASPTEAYALSRIHLSFKLFNVIMHHSRILGPLVTAALVGLSACAPLGNALLEMAAAPNAQASSASASTGLPRCLKPQMYELATQVEGTFTVEDCSVPWDNRSYPVHAYRFTTPERRDVHLVVESPGLDTQLRLLREDGVEMEKDVFTGSFNTLKTQVPAGTYFVMLRSGSSTAERLHGRYTLRSSTERVGFEGCPRQEMLPLDGTVQGEWEVSDCTRALHSRAQLFYFDVYELTVPAQRNVEITLASPGISSILDLYTRDGAPVDQAWGAGRENTIKRQLAPGSYVVRVGTNGTPRETGRYTLRVR